MYNVDPEQVAGGEPEWWWNPLSYVTSDRRALELTDAFVGAYRDPDARPDPFFAPAGQELVSHLLRAAAIANRPVTQAFLWSTRPNDDEPARILQSADTLYLHSKEGQGSSAGLVTALAMALCDAAEQRAKRSPGGRLAVPLVGVLDEAANICRWPQLPDLYSHYGSRGIPLVTLLQSWSQGAQVSVQTGMRKLWGCRRCRWVVVVSVSSRSCWAFCACSSFVRDWFSIWRMRSRVTSNVRPTSSRVRGCSPSSPYRSSTPQSAFPPSHPVPLPTDGRLLANAQVWNLTTRCGNLDISIRPSGTAGYEDLHRNADSLLIAAA